MDNRNTTPSSELVTFGEGGGGGGEGWGVPLRRYIVWYDVTDARPTYWRLPRSDPCLNERRSRTCPRQWWQSGMRGEADRRHQIRLKWNDNQRWVMATMVRLTRQWEKTYQSPVSIEAYNVVLWNPTRVMIDNYLCLVSSMRCSVP